MKNAIKIILGVCMVMILTQLASAELGNHINEYKVISQTGDEAKDIVYFEKVLIDDRSLIEKIISILGITLGEEDIFYGTKICVEKDNVKTYDETLSIYVNSDDIKTDDIDVNVLSVSGVYDVEYCYIANPYEDYYLKFGDTSIEIIRISGAEHLDSSRNYIDDIYSYVNESDNIVYTIPDNEYVRVVFEKNLTDAHRIDVYLNKSGGNIEIYEKDGSDLIGLVEDVTEGWNYIDINHSGLQDTFDMKSVENITYDLIIDPPQPPAWSPATLYDFPDPVTVGTDIKYTGRGDDPDNDDYKLFVCSTSDAMLGGGATPNSCAGTQLCASDFVNDLTNVSCNYTTVVGDIGTKIGFGFICDDTYRCTTANVNASTTVEANFGWLNVSISAPVDNSNYATGNTNLTINATVTCEDGDCGIVYAWARYNYSSECYQETANVSTACGGLDTGTYISSGNWNNLGNVYDGNWATDGDAVLEDDGYLYVNYSKPSGYLNSSKLQIKDGYGSANLTIPNSCWVNNNLSIQIHSWVRSVGGGSGVQWFCLNSTGWVNLRINNGNSGDVFEEAMFWNIQGLASGVDDIIDTTEGALPFYSLFSEIGTPINSFDISSEVVEGNGITTDGTYIWVADDDARIYKYWLNGTFTGENLSMQGDSPTGITTDGNYIWVSDSDDNIYRHQMDGTYIDSFDISSQSNSQGDIETNGTYIWVADWGDGFVYKYSTDGTYINSINVTNQTLSPRGVGVDNNYIFVLDTIKDIVYRYAHNGTYIDSFGSINSSKITISNEFLFGIDFYEVLTQYLSYPFNPKSISLTQGQSYQFNWTLNVTSTDEEAYQVGVFFNSSYGSANVPNNQTTNRTINLNVAGEPAGDCWATIGDVLYVPDGCSYYITGGDYI